MIGWWLVIDDWLMICDWWLFDDLWLMVGWWLMIGQLIDECLMIGQLINDCLISQLLVDDWWLMIDCAESIEGIWSLSSLQNYIEYHAITTKR